MTCKEANDLLHGYLDGELDLVHSLAIEQHLKDCPACASSIREQQTLRAALTGGSLYFSAPDGLDQRVRAAISLEARTEIRAEKRASPRKWTWWSILVPAVATGAVVLVAVLWFARPSPEARLADEFVSAHVRSLMGETGHLTDVASSDQHGYAHAALG